MIQHVTRILTRWLQHPERGLNAILATLPLSVGDPRPTQIYVYNDVDSDAGAEDQPPPQSPAVLLMAYDGVGVEFRAGHHVQEGHRPVRMVLWWLIHRQEAESVRVARVQSSYVWEAVLESLQRNLSFSAAEDRREGTMEVVGLERAQEVRAGEALKDMQVVAALVVSLKVRRIPITRARL